LNSLLRDLPKVLAVLDPSVGFSHLSGTSNLQVVGSGDGFGDNTRQCVDWLTHGVNLSDAMSGQPCSPTWLLHWYDGKNDHNRSICGFLGAKVNSLILDLQAIYVN